MIAERLNLVALALLCMVTPPLAAEQSTLLFPLEYVWRNIYEPAPGIKAMAVAANGASGVALGAPDVGEAERKALETCAERSKFLSLRRKETPPCHLLASMDKWQAPGLTVDDGWQQPAPGKDNPMRKGRKYTVKNAKAIVLHVHGCNGMGDKVFSDVWGAYFNALGFDFYYPDSFAEKRPKEACGVMNEYPIDQISGIWRLRVAQTQRTLAELSKANPGRAIYIWGHSEGGLIVQMLRVDVAGIIVSGEECGVLGAPMAAAANVRFLYLWGEFDQYVNGMGGFRITANSGDVCTDRMRGRLMEFAVLSGRTHIPWPWNAVVAKAVSNFLGETALANPKPGSVQKKIAAAWKKTKPPKDYRNAKPHRAAAVNSKGASFMVWGLDNEEDARQLALFSCTQATSRKANVFQSGKYACTIVDVNGKPVN